MEKLINKIYKHHSRESAVYKCVEDYDGIIKLKSLTGKSPEFLRREAFENAIKNKWFIEIEVK